VFQGVLDGDSNWILGVGWSLWVRRAVVVGGAWWCVLGHDRHWRLLMSACHDWRPFLQPIKSSTSYTHRQSQKCLPSYSDANEVNASPDEAYETRMKNEVSLEYQALLFCALL